MHPRLLALADSQRGPFTAAQALVHGTDGDELVRLVRSGRLVRLRRGVYVEARRVPSTREARHTLDVDALLLVMTSAAVVSHESAAVLHGLELLEPDLGLVHVTRDQIGSSRVQAGVRHHAAGLPESDVTELDGRRATTLERTAVDLARGRDLAGAVVAVDSALRRGASLAEMRRVLFATVSWTGSRTAGRAVAIADPGAESVGESMCRLLLLRLGFPAPRSQVEISDRDGFVGRVDLYFEEHRTVVEFDGRAKYGATDAGDLVWQEKRREDRLRAAGYEVVRVIWADLERPDLVRARLLAAFDRAAGHGLRASG